MEQACPRCTFHNEAGASACAICDSPLVATVMSASCSADDTPDVASWAACAPQESEPMRTCGICTLQNPASRSACEACNAWWCDRCGTSNPTNAAACASCRLHEDSRGDRDERSSKRCDVCTLENPVSRSTCKACMAWWCDQCDACNPADAYSCGTCNRGEEDDGDDPEPFSAAALVANFDAAKLEKRLRRAAKVSPTFLDKIVDDPKAFLAEICGDRPVDAPERFETTPAAPSNVVEPIDVFSDEEEEEDGEDSSFSSDDDDEETYRANSLFESEGCLRRQDAWVCGLCNATHSTANILKAHILVRHVRSPNQRTIRTRAPRCDDVRAPSLPGRRRVVVDDSDDDKSNVANVEKRDSRNDHAILDPGKPCRSSGRSASMVESTARARSPGGRLRKHPKHTVATDEDGRHPTAVSPRCTKRARSSIETSPADPANTRR